MPTRNIPVEPSLAVAPSSIWPTMPNGAEIAPPTRPTTIAVSSRMPRTRQKPPVTSANDLVIASTSGSLSSTISTGANISTVYR